MFTNASAPPPQRVTLRQRRMSLFVEAAEEAEAIRAAVAVRADVPALEPEPEATPELSGVAGVTELRADPAAAAARAVTAMLEGMGRAAEGPGTCAALAEFRLPCSEWVDELTAMVRPPIALMHMDCNPTRWP